MYLVVTHFRVIVTSIDLYESLIYKPHIVVSSGIIVLEFMVIRSGCRNFVKGGR